MLWKGHMLPGKGPLLWSLLKCLSVKGQVMDIFADYVVSAMITQLGHCSLVVALDQKQVSGQECFSLKLY